MKFKKNQAKLEDLNSIENTMNKRKQLTVFDINNELCPICNKKLELEYDGCERIYEMSINLREQILYYECGLFCKSEIWYYEHDNICRKLPDFTLTKITDLTFYIIRHNSD